MKAKKILTLLLAMALCAALCACGGSTGGGSTGGGAPATGSPDTQGTAAPANDGKVYTLKFASSVAEGSMRNVGIEIPFKELLEERSGGRIKLEIYSNSTLVAQPEALDALTNDLCDFSYVVTGMYPGQFLYTELFSTPGLQLGDIDQTDATLREYFALYPEKNLEGIKEISSWSVGSMSIVCNKDIASFDDFKGMNIRMTAAFMPLFEQLNVGCVNMGASEIYESIRLNVIDGAVVGFSDIASFQFAEVTDHCVLMPILRGSSMIGMSWDAYNSLPDDLKAVVDEVSEEMDAIVTEYNKVSEEAVMEAVYATNPDFQFVSLPDGVIDDIDELCVPLMDAKAAELDAAGLDGSGALAWLRSKAVG